MVLKIETTIQLSTALLQFGNKIYLISNCLLYFHLYPIFFVFGVKH